MEAWLSRLTVNHLNALAVIFTGQLYPLGRMPIENDFLEAHNSIVSYRESDIFCRIHNSLTPSWEVLPYAVSHTAWQYYLAVLHSFIEESRHSPTERTPRQLYIHCTVYLPFNVILHANTRYQIYLMFLKLTPIAIFSCISSFRFRFFFIATSTLNASIEFARIRYSDEWSEPFYYDVVIEQ